MRLFRARVLACLLIVASGACAQDRGARLDAVGGARTKSWSTHVEAAAAAPEAAATGDAATTTTSTTAAAARPPRKATPTTPTTAADPVRTPSGVIPTTGVITDLPDVPEMPTLPPVIPPLTPGGDYDPNDPCYATLPERGVDDAEAPGTYEYLRATGNLRLVAASVGPAAFNPDGHRLAYAIGSEGDLGDRICLGDRRTGHARTLVAGVRVMTNPNFPPQWAGPNSLLYVSQEFPGIALYRFDVLAAKATRLAPSVLSMRVSPDGLTVAYAVPQPDNASGELYLMPALGGPARHLFTNPYWGIISLTWSPDGLTLAVGDPLFLVNTVTGAATKHLGCGGGVWGGAWSPLGTQFAFTSNSTECIFVLDRLTDELTQIGTGGGPGDWSLDGHLLVVAHPPPPDDRTLGATLDEVAADGSGRRNLLTVAGQHGEYHYFNATYDPLGLTIRVAHTIVR